MSESMRPLTRCLQGLENLALWISGCCLVAMTAAITWQVYGRFILNDTPSWAEPLSLMLMLYFILLGAAVGVRRRFHLGLDLLRHIVGPRIARVLDVLIFLLVGGFGAAMAWYGGELMLGTWSTAIPVLGVPEGMNHIPMVVSGCMIVLFCLEHVMVLAGYGDDSEFGSEELDLADRGE